MRTCQGIDYEIIVVDSLTTRQSRDIVRERTPRAKFLGYKTNLGFSRGVNIGLKNSIGKFLLVLNPDIVMSDDTVEKLLSYIQRHKDIGMVGPQLRNFNGTIQQNYFNFYTPLTIAARRSFLGKLWPFRQALADFLMTGSDPNKIQTPDWLMGSALMLRREAVAQVGPMDERFFMYFEDVDWARRFWHNGYKVVYYPKAVAYHYHQRESKSALGIFDAFFNQKTRWHIQSAVKFFRKYRELALPR